MNPLLSLLSKYVKPPPRRRRPGMSRRLLLEQLEDRTVPSGFDFIDFSNASTLSLVGAASITPDYRLRLTPALGGQQGAAWYTAQKQFAGLAFETSFQFQMTENADPPGGSDGFVFILQNTVPTYLAGGGGTLGYDGLSNSLAVEFDTFQNSEVNDPSQSHISVHTNGTGPNGWSESLSLGVYDTSPALLDDAAMHTAKIAYTPGTLSIYLDNLTTPKLTVAVDLAEKLALDAGQAWVGFTAATGGGWQNHDILNWNYTVIPDVTTTAWVNDASAVEGNAGTSDLIFTINRSGDTSGTMTVNWATEDRTAAAASDYTAASGQVEFGPDQTQATVAIAVLGDSVIEPHETFVLRLTGVSGGSIADGIGIGTIVTDDVTVSISDDSVVEGDPSTRFFDEFVSQGSGGLRTPRGVTFGPDGNLYVGHLASAAVLRFDGQTGQFIDVFADGSGVATEASTVVFHNGYLFVATGTSGILRFDGTTGEPRPAPGKPGALFATPADQGIAEGVHGLAFGPDGKLYLTSNTTNLVLRYDGSSGQFLDVFVPAGSGGLAAANAVAFGGDGHLYVGSNGNNAVLRYQGPLESNPGAFIDTFVGSGSGGLSWIPAAGMRFGSDGDLYVSSRNTSSVLRFDGATGAFVEAVVASGEGGLTASGGITFDDQGRLYVASQNTHEVLRYGPATQAVFTVSLSSASGVPVTVSYATANGSATAGSDYTETSGTLTFAPGQTMRTILVPILDDTAMEGPETLLVDLSSAVGATIIDAQATGTVLDDDAVEPSSGLVSWWTGDGTAADLMTRNNGIVFNGAGFAAGQVADGFNFDGIDDNVQAPTAGLPTGSADRTIELWAKIDQHVAGEAFFASYGAPGSYSQVYTLGALSDGRVFVSTWGPAITGPVLQTGRWYHVAASNVGRSFKLYLDGVQVAAGDMDVDTPAGSIFWMGRQTMTSIGDYRRLDGLVDEVSVYNRALTAQEVQRIYNAGSTGKIKMLVAKTNPDAGANVSVPRTSFTVDFSYPYAAASVQAGDFKVNGIAATLVTLTDADTLTFTFATSPVTAEGPQTMHMDFGAVTRASDGLPLATYDGSFTFSGTKFYVVNDGGSDRTYEYGVSGNSVENYALGSANTAPRGAASTAAGDKVWVLDANKTVYIYNPAGGLLGSWSAGSMTPTATPEGITTNGTDIWIVDGKQDRVFKYAGAAGRLSGSQNAASNFSLNAGNKDPKGIVTDGTSLWVVNDSTTDKVFKYTLAGSLVGSWTITGGGGAPTGITLDPTDVRHLWIVDNGSDRVYQYDNAASRTSGSQAASLSFALAAGNTNPQDIADPPAPSTPVAVIPAPQPLTGAALAAFPAADGAWFADPTPWNRGGFLNPADQGEPNRITVFFHQLGRLLGGDHAEGEEESLTGSWLMPAAASVTDDPVLVDQVFAGSPFQTGWEGEGQ